VTKEKRLWTVLGIMALLSPIGIILPRQFKAGEAWGEWGSDSLQKLLGYLPSGFRLYRDWWKAPVPDYAFGVGHTTLLQQALSYMGSGLLGVLIVGGIVYLISRLLVKHGR
jgi:cobalt/nickel transport protein